MSFFSDGWSFGRSFTYSCPPSGFHCCCCWKILEKFIFWFYYFDINKIYGPQTESLPNINITYNKVLIISETSATTTPAITIKQKRNNINNITRTDGRMDDLSYLFLVGHGLLFLWNSEIKMSLAIKTTKHEWSATEFIRRGEKLSDKKNISLYKMQETASETSSDSVINKIYKIKYNWVNLLKTYSEMMLLFFLWWYPCMVSDFMTRVARLK